MGCCQSNQQPTPIKASDFHLFDLKLTERIDAKHKSIVYGYIRRNYCQTSPMFLPTDIHNMILLFYFCMDRYPYTGGIGHWTKKELYDKYLPVNPAKLYSNGQATDPGVFFEGEATCYHKPRNIKYGNKVFLRKIKQIDGYPWPWGKMMLLRELRILRTLYGHPSIIRLYDVLPPVDCDHINSLNLIYEYSDTYLRIIFNTAQYFRELHCQYILYQILLGVQYIHDSGIVHRDLRPGAILIDEHSCIKITGFWASCGLNEEIECKRAHITSRSYRSPETVLLQVEDLKAADMWSVGCIFGELLQMISVKPRQRKPLFQGNSCFFLSHGTNRVHGSQMQEIFKFISPPTGHQMDWIIEPTARNYINEVRSSMPKEGVDLSKQYPRTSSAGLDLLRGLLRFDVAKRLTASDALKSPYFDGIRDGEWFDYKCLPKLYVGFEYDRIDDITLRNGLIINVYRNYMLDLNTTG
eukprot:67217_1